MLARLRAMSPIRADLLLAGLFFLEATAEILFLVPAGTDGKWAVVLLVAAFAGTLAIRRLSPALAVLAVMPLFIVAGSLGDDYIDHMVSPFFATLLVLYGVGRHLEGRVVWLLTAYGVAGMWTATAIDNFDDELGSYVVSALALICGPVLLGRVLRNRAQLNRTLREKAQRLEAERVQRAAAAAEEERSRIAGELHDVVAHALSAMVVQASGARRLAERDPVRAGDAFLAVETSGREALTEIRRLLGVLRREDEELALAPQPSLRHVGSLVGRFEAAGLPVELSVEGEAGELPLGIDLTAYRVLQEALGGALEHGHAGLARVKVRYSADLLELEVADDGGAPARPLLGIRERVTLLGGQLRAGARRDGGHVVRARLPLRGPA
ncbi:MAG TPA: histidine kinase [Solirubrobacteraceae bacterium]|nr:histidine kinase [Solirubrobacteraceae bacterium]